MEDRNIIAHNLCGSPHMHMMAVFDGHRGAEAAEYAESHLTAVLEACCMTADSPTAALKQAFIQLEAGGLFEFCPCVLSFPCLRQEVCRSKGYIASAICDSVVLF